MTKQGVHIDENQIAKWLREIHDPEIPVLNIIELGIVRSIQPENNKIKILITPTYSGCPAISAIEKNIQAKLKQKGYEQVTVKKDFSASWTTDWMTDKARRKLQDFGISPPEHLSHHKATKPLAEKTIACPYCESENTSLQSEFGSTACKAQFYCHECEQAFEYFKCH